MMNVDFTDFTFEKENLEKVFENVVFQTKRYIRMLIFLRNVLVT